MLIPKNFISTEINKIKTPKKIINIFFLFVCPYACLSVCMVVFLSVCLLVYLMIEFTYPKTHSHKHTLTHTCYLSEGEGQVVYAGASSDSDP